MEDLLFELSERPFPDWLGPYKPPMGTDSGYRVRKSNLCTVVSSENRFETWTVVSDGVRNLVNTVVRHFSGGGRLLILPNGYVIKPLQDEVEVGRRQLIGTIHGSIVLKKSDGALFDFDQLDEMKPGDAWEGPNTTGLVCSISRNGSLRCKWALPTKFGTKVVEKELRAKDSKLWAGFTSARPNATGGRVRVQASGHVITNCEVRFRKWKPFYVGHADPNSWICDWCCKDWEALSPKE